MILKSEKKRGQAKKFSPLGGRRGVESRCAIRSSLAKTTATRLDVIKAGVTVCTAADSRSPA